MNPKRIILIIGGFVILLVALYWFFFIFSFGGGCILSIQEARNPITGEVRFFPTPCAVPLGWQQIDGVPIDSPKSNEITWEEAVDLIGNCQVTQVSQSHSRHVSIVLKSDEVKTTKEPQIDLVLDEALKASDKCGFPIIMETE